MITKQQIDAWESEVRAHLQLIHDQYDRIALLTALLKRAMPEHYGSECMGSCMDDEPERCGTLKLIADIEAALKETN